MNPLENLKDIHTPDAIGNWPPAYGWWLLAIIILIVTFLLIKWSVRAYKIRAAKRQAMQQLTLIENDNQNGNAKLNQLIKRVALNYFTDLNVQQMHGDTWTQFLISSYGKKANPAFVEGITALQHSLYQQHKSNNFEQHKDAIKLWIKAAVPPKKSTLKTLEKNHA